MLYFYVTLSGSARETKTVEAEGGGAQLLINFTLFIQNLVLKEVNRKLCGQSGLVDSGSGVPVVSWSRRKKVFQSESR